jgi:hypothetical protein
LCQVFGLFAAADHAKNITENLLFVASDDLVEGGEVIALTPGDENGVRLRQTNHLSHFLSQAQSVATGSVT